jgi:hypothetical protein
MNSINGVTAGDISRIMRHIEKTIRFYNLKYNYDISLGTKKEISQYESLIKQWDKLKVTRNKLNA